jgi:hypothetical protein
MNTEDTMKDVAGDLTDKAQEFVQETVAEKIHEVAGGVVDKVEGLADSVGLGDELDTAMDKAEAVAHIDLDGDGDVAGE